MDALKCEIGEGAVAVGTKDQLLAVKGGVAVEGEGADFHATGAAFGADRGHGRVPVAAEVARYGPDGCWRGGDLATDKDALVRHRLTQALERTAVAAPQRIARGPFV